MINQIGKITIYVKNQQEAKKFWVEKAGFVVKAEIPMGPNMTWLEVGPSAEAFTSFIIYEKDLMLAQNKDANVAHPSILLSTTDLEKTYEELNANGVKTTEIQIMPYGKMFNFYDQDDNIYLLREDK
ncbi:MAG: VOC family protein [bacterium]|nr:VOC family protein [bacterium]